MEIQKAEDLARSLMAKYDLHDWRFSFDNAKRRAGACNHTKRTISLSIHLVRIRSDDNVRNTILHEIAHALVGRGHGHNRIWKRKALEIGCDGKRCYTDAKIEGKWVAICAHGKRFSRHRRPYNSIIYSCLCIPGKPSILKYNENAKANRSRD
jgi:hypothetical protein